MIALWEKACLARKKWSAHRKLEKARARVQALLASDTTEAPLKSLDEIMQHMHGMIDTGKAFPVRALVNDYFFFRLHHRGADPAPYVFESEFMRYRAPLLAVQGEENALLNDKRALNRFLLSHGVPSTRQFGTTLGHGDSPAVVDGNGGTQDMHNLLLRQGSLFIKPVDGMQGQSCALWLADGGDRVVQNGRNMPWSEAAATIRDGMLVEEVVRQHPDLAALHPHSLNTLRITTVRGEDGEIVLMPGFLRIGVHGKRVNNLAAGGLGCCISDNGTLFPTARIEEPPTLPEFTEHPDTHVRFEGVRVPYWDECRNLLKRAHALFPRTHDVGWDVAVTPDGPLIIEANPAWAFMPVQGLAPGMGLRQYLKPLFAQAAIRAGARNIDGE